MISPLGPLYPIARVRSGAATGFWPVGSASEKIVRLAPTWSSLETGTGNTEGDPEAPADGLIKLEAVGGTADDGPQAATAIDRTAASTPREGLESMPVA